MATSGAGTPRFTTYTTIAEYNAAHPDVPMPGNLSTLRSYTVAGAGLIDDVTASEKKHTLDFLPSLPEAGEPDRRGSVVASRWGQGPYLVLAENVLLKAAWDAITGRWPAELSEAADILRTLTDSPGTAAN
jgi:hypothetical protein